MQSISITPSVAEVKAECERRILDRYKLPKQITLLDAGGPAAEAYRAFRDAMIAASHRLEGMTPIPGDYTDDRHWTGDKQ